MKPKDNFFVYGLFSCKANSSWKPEGSFLWKSESRKRESCKLPGFWTKLAFWKLSCWFMGIAVSEPLPRAGFPRWHLPENPQVPTLAKPTMSLAAPATLALSYGGGPAANPTQKDKEVNFQFAVCWRWFIWPSRRHFVLAFETFHCVLVESCMFIQKLDTLCKYLGVAGKHCSIKCLKKVSESAVYGKQCLQHHHRGY